MILVFKTTTATPYNVSRLELSPIVNQPAAQQQHIVWVGGTCGALVGGATQYVVTPKLC
jgi:hypothetical protein